MSAAQSVGPQALPALQEQVEQILAEAKRQGASACEVAVSLEQGLSTSVRQREVETVEFNRDQGFGITLYVGQGKGSAGFRPVPCLGHHPGTSHRTGADLRSGGV